MIKDTLTGTLHYDDERVAMGTMAYKQVSLATKLDEVAKGIGKLNVNLKLLPDVDGKPKVAQLVGYNLEDILVHGAWNGPACLHMLTAASSTCPYGGSPGAAIKLWTSSSPTDVCCTTIWINDGGPIGGPARSRTLKDGVAGSPIPRDTFAMLRGVRRGPNEGSSIKLGR